MHQHIYRLLANKNFFWYFDWLHELSNDISTINYEPT